MLRSTQNADRQLQYAMVHRILIVEDDITWCEILTDVFSEYELIAEWASTRMRALEKLANRHTAYDAVFIDAGLEAYPGIASTTMPPTSSLTAARKAFPILNSLADLNFSGPVLLASGLLGIEELRALAVTYFPMLQCFCFEKRSLDPAILIEIFMSSAPKSSNNLEDSEQVALSDQWRRLCSDRDLTDGKLLESSVYELFHSAGYFSEVRRNIRSSTAEFDLLLIRDSDSLFEAPAVAVVECKDRNNRVSAADVRVLMGKMQELDSKLGIFVSRSGLAGGAAGQQGAARLINDLYKANKLSIIHFSFSECEGIASGRLNLIQLMKGKQLSLRVGATMQAQ